MNGDDMPPTMQASNPGWVVQAARQRLRGWLSAALAALALAGYGVAVMTAAPDCLLSAGGAATADAGAPGRVAARQEGDLGSCLWPLPSDPLLDDIGVVRARI